MTAWPQWEGTGTETQISAGVGKWMGETTYLYTTWRAKENRAEYPELHASEVQWSWEVCLITLLNWLIIISF